MLQFYCALNVIVKIEAYLDKKKSVFSYKYTNAYTVNGKLQKQYK